MSSSTRPPIRICVIQLGKIAETLQSLMALRAAKQIYPEIEFTLVINENLASVAARTPWIQSVFPLPRTDLIRADDETALKKCARWIAPLVSSRWDMVLNWTYTEASSYLSALLPTRVRYGLSRNKDFSIKAIDGWSQYIQGIIQGSVPQNIHLTDILTTQLLTALQIHVGDPTRQADPNLDSSSFFKLKMERQIYSQKLIDASTQWVAIQIGSENEKHSYSPEKWAEVIRLILDRHPQYSIVLLGSEKDKPTERVIKDILNQGHYWKEKILSVVGETDFDLWATLVHRSNWCLSADSGVVHLASILGTRCIYLSIGQSSFYENGPYGNGHFVIRQDGTQPEPKIVYGAFNYAHLSRFALKSISFESHYESLNLQNLPERLEVYRSRIRSTEEGGGVHYEPLTLHPQSETEWLSMAVGYIARAWYCGWTPKLGQELTRTTLTPPLLTRLRKLEESACVLSKIFKEARITSSALAFKSSRIKNDHIMSVQKKSDLQEHAKKLIELENLADRLVQTEPLLAGFVHLSRVLMHNLDGAHISEMAKQSASAYRQLEDGIQILNDWIQHTLRLAKPVPLSPVHRIQEDKSL